VNSHHPPPNNNTQKAQHSRRTFGKKLVAGLLGYTLIDSLLATQALSAPVQAEVNGWLKQLNERCADLRQQQLTLTDWQTQAESLLQQLPMAELLQTIDFERLTKGFEYPDLGVITKAIRLPALTGLPQGIQFYPKLFGMQQNRAIIPHGHSNMVSAHLVLKGSLALKHYDKVQEEANHLVMKPTVDTTATAGSVSSISDQHNNIHWFIATTPTAFAFDIIITDLYGKPYHIHNIDPYRATKIGNGLLRAPKLSVQDALKKYGKHSHH